MSRKYLRHFLLMAALTIVLSSNAIALSFRQCVVARLTQEGIENLADLKVAKTKGGGVKVAEKELKLTQKESKELLESLSAYFKKADPTTSRVEEKAVLTQKHLDEFFETTKDIPWDMRDKVVPGTVNKTITEYGEKLSFLDPKTGITANAKPRFRKYFQIKDDGSVSSIMDDAVAFEFKMKHIQGFDPDKGELIIKEGVVFKPRIFVSDEIADKIKRLDGTDPKIISKINKLKKQTLDYVGPGGKKSNTDEVENMFAMLEYMIKKDPDYFKPKTVTTYERTAYKAQIDPETQYQFTVDRDVQLYDARADLNSRDMHLYLTGRPYFQVKEGELFVELKTPTKEFDGGTDVYKQLSTEMKRNANVDEYDLDAGKFALGNKQKALQSTYHDGNHLVTEGPYFWFVKNMGNNYEMVKRTDILNKGIYPMTIPFTGKNGKQYSLLLTYQKPGNVLEPILDLKNIKVLDEMGDKVDLGVSLNDVRKQVVAKGLNVMSSITIDGKKINLVGQIDGKEAANIQKFAEYFFREVAKNTANKRSLAVLQNLENTDDLNKFVKKVRLGNLRMFLQDRGAKHTPVFIALGVIPAAGTYLWSRFTVSEAEQINEINGGEVIDEQPIVVDGLHDENDNDFKLIIDDRKEPYRFFTDNADLQNKKPGEVVVLRDADGNQIELVVKDKAPDTKGKYLEVPEAKPN